MSTEIILNQVDKYYGKHQALKKIDLTIGQGMFGLLGTNGAGKTTLMKIITTLLHQSSGKVEVCGIPVEKANEVRSMIGYLPQDFSMYGGMSVYEAMDYLGVLSGLSRHERKSKIPDLLEQVNLQNNRKTKVKALSGGMKRRLGIAQAILHDPKVLIVDEPTTGLDPEERVRVRNLLSEAAENRIVILSTHIVGDVEATCEKIAIMKEGSIIYTGTVLDLLDIVKDRIFTAQISRMELDQVRESHVVTNIISQGSQAQIRFLSNKDKIFIENASPATPNVEDAYMYLMQQERGKAL